METNVKKFFLKTLENQWNVRIFRKNDVLRCYGKENGLKLPQNGILRVWKPRLVLLEPYNFLITCYGRSKRPYFRFFQQAARTIGCVTKKVLFFLSKMNWNFVPNRTLVKFLFGQSLTIIVDRDLILKIENLPLIFHPGAFAELGIREASSRG